MVERLGGGGMVERLGGGGMVADSVMVTLRRSHVYFLPGWNGSSRNIHQHLFY